ncbi:nucleoside deaminase [Leifsonia sp. NCR5]|uniref:nucleoside deaminase n=1 Tax=Leifsonia sp. NCR5 TaxID=1978342 RepID=UPI001C4E750E|nr:deaminase [Leifsonia sp. NCR5]
MPREKLVDFMDQAVAACVAHVDAGGLPFVGAVVDESGLISSFGVNRVRETRDASAHAEIIAMREVLAASGRKNLAGTTLLATGEPCGLCYRFALDHGIDAIYVAVDRDDAAAWGFDYRSSYTALGITDERRSAVLRPLPVHRGTEPFDRYLQSHTNQGR